MNNNNIERLRQFRETLTSLEGIDYCFNHCKERLFERFGSELTREKWDELNWEIFSDQGKSRIGESHDDAKKSLIVTRIEGERCLAVFSEVHFMLVTILPRDDIRFTRFKEGTYVPLGTNVVHFNHRKSVFNKWEEITTKTDHPAYIKLTEKLKGQLDEVKLERSDLKRRIASLQDAIDNLRRGFGGLDLRDDVIKTNIKQVHAAHMRLNTGDIDEASFAHVLSLLSGEVVKVPTEPVKVIPQVRKIPEYKKNTIRDWSDGDPNIKLLRKGCKLEYSFNGVTKNMSEWAEFCGLSQYHFRQSILQIGMSKTILAARKEIR